MIHRLYTWEAALPADLNPEQALQAAQEAAERVATYNPSVEGTEVSLTAEGALRATVHFTGRDQWWIKKRVVYTIVPILTRAHIPRANAKLVAVDRLEDRRSTRERASDGRSNPLPEHVDIDHSDMGLVAQGGNA